MCLEVKYVLEMGLGQHPSANVKPKGVQSSTLIVGQGLLTLFFLVLNLLLRKNQCKNLRGPRVRALSSQI